MDTYYQLFDLESGNLIADFAQEHEAWDALRSLEPDEIHRLGLVRMEDDEVTLVAMEDDLVRRVNSNVVPFTVPEPIRRKAR
jgi:hypothetical protein